MKSEQPFVPAATMPPPQLLGRGHRSRRRVAVLAGTAALAVAALTGGGIAFANQTGQSPRSTSASGSSQAPSTDLTRGRHGTPPGAPTDGTAGGTAGGTDTEGSNDGSGDTSGTNGTADPATSVATDTQEVGLVEISSELTSGEAAGTGMILSSTGEVVTNHHVVEGATSIKVTVLSTGAT